MLLGHRIKEWKRTGKEQKYRSYKENMREGRREGKGKREWEQKKEKKNRKILVGTRLKGETESEE